ncbi:MAG TPA: YicC/YloC family endoribonuclease [Methylovirgula sp.]
MTLASMTGFARVAGASASYRWAWELKSVNAKGLDLRVRMAPGFDPIEAVARARLAQVLTRGTCYATLSVQRETVVPEVRVNQDLLRLVTEALAGVALTDKLRPASLDGLLGIRGIVEIRDRNDDEVDLGKAQAGVLASLDTALAALIAMRESEGGALAQILNLRIERLGALQRAAEDCPARKPEAIRARLSETLTLLSGHAHFDEARLYQEALLLAAKADIREELDRLAAHIAAVADLLQKGGPIGRKLDFLAQELGREANTLCAKSNDASLTAIGLELRVEIEQFREQIQNIE